MPNEQTDLPVPGIDERAIVAAMIRNPDSLYWTEYWDFVKVCVFANAKNIPSSLHEDIIQEVMYRLAKYLPYFRFHCTLKTWMNLIVVHCIIDAHRKLQNERLYPNHYVDSPNENGHESEELSTSEEKSAEDAFMTKDEIRSGWAACVEYAGNHTNSTRNYLIIKLVIEEGKTYAEAAKAAGCNEPVVGYVVREAQRYARKMRDQQ